MWQRVRDGLGPDAGLVADVAREETGALGAARVAQSREALAARVLGAGPLEGWLCDSAVTDLAVNGDGRVWIDRGDGMEWTGEVIDVEAARILAVRLAAAAGRRLDEASPWVDGQLPSGARLHAVLPPLVAEGPHITIRVPAREHLSLDMLGAAGMFPPEWAPVLQGIVRQRLAFVVSGGTGAGKTTLLAALLGLVDPTERVLVIEDVRELHVDHPHVVRLEARPANVEGAGEVTLTTLVRQSLRMRPDRIVVGEVRGAEVRELLAALNTGHEGGCGTVHANAPEDVVARFEALGALAGLGPMAVRAQLAAAVDVVVHVARRGSARRVETIAALFRRGGEPVIETALTWRGVGRPADPGPAWAALAHRLGLDPAIVLDPAPGPRLAPALSPAPAVERSPALRPGSAQPSVPGAAS
jgi:pilus assembly protein CpaF